ncbi:MAG: TonB-dependent receptor [Bryobacterales bacterium]|nr:TonB-dependent receptor [Bryobacterales bacterium]MBV9398730.1 TonB-dependent receptor [Bryobacterales bacterium]
MGATVSLYNRYDQLVRQSLTNGTGKFIFDGLTPDTYSIRVVLASFLPAVRRNIAVAPGSENLLKINLANVLSTVELVPASASQGTLMTDDWKWVLRSSQATRPVLRLMPAPSSSKPQSTLANFSDITGVLRVSGGDGDPYSGTASQDLGTAFGLATLVNGYARVRLSGNIGYMANSGLPSGGFRATYSRDNDYGFGPQLALTAHQVYFPGLGPAGDSSQTGDQTGPVMRTATFSFIDKLEVIDGLRLEYGGHIESVAFEQRVTYISPFARATYDLGNKGAVKLAFSSGTPPAELIVQSLQAPEGQVNDQAALNQDLAALSILPRISHRNGQMELQRNETWEAGYEIVRGSRKYSFGAYVEDVKDPAYLVSGPVAMLPAANLLPDYGSQNFVLNVGGFWRSGYLAAVTQSLGDRLDVTGAVGQAGALVGAPDTNGQVRMEQRPWVSARASTTVAETGTHIVASYGWTDFRSLMPVHVSLTDTTMQEQGLNVMVRQPLPRLNCLRGRIEATVEVRNALGQGYLPIAGGPGGRTMLTNSPRTLRGGLNFLF